MRLLPKFQEYLLRKGMVKDKAWVENTLKQKFFKSYVHLAKMVE